MSMEELYQETILEHWEKPRNKGELGEGARKAALRNPLCGDEIHLHVEVEGDVVKKIRFSGHGCSISQAAASMMSELVEGKTVAEAEKLREQFLTLLRGELDEESKEGLGDLAVLENVKKFPARLRCALLGFEALEKTLSESGEG